GNIVVQGGLLIITDTAANVGRLLQIVSVLDVEVATDELRLIPIRYADAVELARILNEFFTSRRVRPPAPAGPIPTPPPAPRGTDPHAPASPGAARRTAHAGRAWHRRWRGPSPPHPRRQTHERPGRVRPADRRRARVQAELAPVRRPPGEQR